jgi:NDP-sugar pyrophosphorylase family protein
MLSISPSTLSLNLISKPQASATTHAPSLPYYATLQKQSLFSDTFSSQRFSAEPATAVLTPSASKKYNDPFSLEQAYLCGGVSKPGFDLKPIEGSQGLHIVHEKKGVLGNVTGAVKQTGEPTPILAENKSGHVYSLIPVTTPRGQFYVMGLENSKVSSNGVTIAIGQAGQTSLAPDVNAPKDAFRFEDAVKTKHLNNIMVLTGGVGKRTEPLTSSFVNVAKPASTIYISNEGKPVSVMQEIMSDAVLHGMKNMYANTYYAPDSVRSQFKEIKDFAQSKGVHDLRIKEIDETKMDKTGWADNAPSGTAGSLYELLRNADKYGFDKTKPLAVVAGDALGHFPWGNIEKEFFSNPKNPQADVVIISKPMPAQKVLNTYGLVQWEKDSAGHMKVTGFSEKPKTLEQVKGEGGYVDPKTGELTGDANLLGMVFSPKALAKIETICDGLIEAHRANPNAKLEGNAELLDYGSRIFPTMIKEAKEYQPPFFLYDWLTKLIPFLPKPETPLKLANFHYTEGPWLDLGCPEDFYKMRQSVKQPDFYTTTQPVAPAGTMSGDGNLYYVSNKEDIAATKEVLKAKGIQTEGQVMVIKASPTATPILQA